jgi:hypothetical protein
VNRSRSLGLAGLLALAVASMARADGPCPRCGGYHGGPPPAAQRQQEADAASARGKEVMDAYQAKEKELREAYERGASERVRELNEQAAALHAAPDRVPRPALTELSDTATKLRMQELALRLSLAEVTDSTPKPTPAATIPGVRPASPPEPAPDPSMTALMGREMSRLRRAITDRVVAAETYVERKVEDAKERATAPVRTAREKIDELRRDLDDLGKE